MTIDELIEIAKSRPFTAADMEAFAERCRKRNEEFQEMEKSQFISQEFLNRQYTI